MVRQGRLGKLQPKTRFDWMMAWITVLLLHNFIQVQSVAGLLVPIITIKSLIDMDV